MAEYTLVIGNRNYSSWSLRPWLAFKATGQPFREISVRLFEPGTQAAIAPYSPSGKVPVLLEGATPLAWDSLAICETLADLFPAATLWPEQAAARAHARSLCAEMHAGFLPLRQECAMDMQKRVNHTATPDTRACLDRIGSLWREARSRFGAGGPFLFGRFTIADAFYAPVASRIKSYGLKVEGADEYLAALWALPALQEWEKAALQEAPRA